MPVADRYLSTGPGMAKIYPGKLTALVRAFNEAQAASARLPGRHYLEAVYGSSRVTVRVYEGGKVTWCSTSPPETS